MTGEERLKIVFFDEYCTKCKHEAVDENQEPCETCLIEFMNWASHKPVKFEEK